MFETIDSIAPICASLHTKDKTIVLATGFFDLLHSEHIKFLQKAKSTGDILVVAVESDERARAIKGEGRPVETQLVRCSKVAEYANYVIALPPDFDHFEAYDSLMSAIRPNIYAVSAHTDHIKSKTFLVEKYGGKLVVVHDFNPNVSTTQLINSQMV
ncbi:MAG: adenylyltransferase/cytidyltransferase family protein [Microgenomates group bacterium]